MFFRCFRAPLLVSSFSNAPQSWRDDKAQKGRSEKIEVNGISHGLTKDDAENDLMLSYPVANDLAHAERLKKVLTAKSCSVYWDKVCL